MSSKKVSFQSQGVELVGELFLPENYQGAALPTVVITGAWTTVKEQMPKSYAKAFAKQGYAAFIFDFKGWGESAGKNRFIEDPQSKTQDILSALEFLSQQKDVDTNRMVGLGICASSGYMAKAYTQSPHLKAVALVAPWLHNPSIASGIYGGDEAVAGLIAQSEAAHENYLKTGEMTLAVAASATDEKSVMYQAPYYTEPERGLIPEYDNKFNLESWKAWLKYDALASATDLPGPLLMVASESMALPAGAKAYAEIAGDKVQIKWLDNVSQFDFYDKVDIVQKASQQVVQFFNQGV